MATISEAFSIAVQHHQAGRLQTAEQIYRQILAADPDQAQAWHLLGVIAHQTGRHQAAIDCIQHSIRLDGSDARAHSNLGEAFRPWENSRKRSPVISGPCNGSPMRARSITTWGLR